jgi:manganese/zinc/iron transport system permease protein
MPTGAIIVICAGVQFTLSMLFAPQRGIVAAVLRDWKLRRRVADQHLLRALIEHEEHYGEDIPVNESDLLAARSWFPRTLRRVISRSVRHSEAVLFPERKIGLTTSGRAHARRVLRNHRLWEMYLIRYADIAPSHVDRDADEVEHILSDAVILDLERALAEERAIPPSPHAEGGLA